MSLSITYDGVEGADSGNIFAGKRFWVAQRVPMRSTFVNQIKSNGGTVVPLEKQADYLIADHMRKDSPAGSCSYKFIEDSVRNGILQLEDRYRFGREPDAPRPAGSGSLGKGTRAPFTVEDDAALAKWVLSHPIHRTGNALYQDFEAINPRHTWQSWRNRWGKKLSTYSQDVLEQMANSAPSLQEAQPTTEGRNSIPRPTNHQRAERGDINPPDVPRQYTPERREPAPQNNDQEQHELGQEDDRQGQDATEDEEAYSFQQQFYADLKEFAQQRDLSIVLQPDMGGTAIELWDLAQAANSQEVPPEDVDWNLVAGELGFGRASRDLAGRLQRCWQDNLSAFLEAMAEYEQEIEQEDEDREDGVEPNFRAVEREPELPSDPPSPSTHPTSGPRRKRSLDEEVPSSRPKRRRLDRDAEIPSTPDDVLKVVRQTPQESPTARKRPLAHRVEVKDSQEDSQATLGLPRTPNGKRTAFESQALRPDAQHTATLNTQQSSFDVTPSQQLRYESRLSASPEQDVDAERGRQGQENSTPGSTPKQQPQTSKSTPDLGSRLRQHAKTSASPSALPRPVRRSLPASFANRTRQLAQSPPSSHPLAKPQKSPDTHDPGNDPDPRPRRDTPNFDTIEGWVEHYQAMGYPHRTVVAALKSTTMTPGGLAAHVMESLRSGQGLPTHHEGVWTDRDDKSLRLVSGAEAQGDLEREATDAQEMRVLTKAKKEKKRLQHKHGERRAALRREFLKAQDQESRV